MRSHAPRFLNLLIALTLSAGATWASPEQQALFWANEQDSADLRQAVKVLVTSGKLESFMQALSVSTGGLSDRRKQELRAFATERAYEAAKKASKFYHGSDFQGYRAVQFGAIKKIEGQEGYTCEVAIETHGSSRVYSTEPYTPFSEKHIVLIPISEEEKIAISQ